MSRTPRTVNLPLRLDKFPHGSMPVRIAAAVRELVADGTLTPGEHLPSTRALAASLNTSRGTVVAAYQQLTAEGYLDSARGSGTVISDSLAALPRPQRSEPRQGTANRNPQPRAAVHAAPRTTGAWTDELLGASKLLGASAIDMRPGASRGISLPNPQWRAAWRAAANTVVQTPDLMGEPALREALAERWRRVRAVGADPAEVVVTSGARDGLLLLLLSLREARNVPHGTPLRIAFENPGYPSLRQVPTLTGDSVTTAPTDEFGVDPQQLPEDLDALVVTPSHQYPFGGSLPVERRLALLAASRERGFILIEDEHTAEWRWAGAPLPALSGLDAEAGVPRVTAMVGSMSSLLHPGVGVGFVTLPHELTQAAESVRARTGIPVSTMAQLALAQLISSGALDRQLQSAKSHHRRALAQVEEAFYAQDRFALQPVPGGLQAVAVARTEVSEAEVVANARTRGVIVTGLGEYWLGAAANAQPGIVLGFGLGSEWLRTGLDRLLE